MTLFITKTHQVDNRIVSVKYKFFIDSSNEFEKTVDEVTDDIIYKKYEYETYRFGVTNAKVYPYFDGRHWHLSTHRDSLLKNNLDSLPRF